MLDKGESLVSVYCGVCLAGMEVGTRMTGGSSSIYLLDEHLVCLSCQAHPIHTGGRTHISILVDRKPFPKRYTRMLLAWFQACSIEVCSEGCLFSCPKIKAWSTGAWLVAVVVDTTGLP